MMADGSSKHSVDGLVTRRGYVTQVTAVGPLGMEYMNAKDDPRSAHNGIDRAPLESGQVERDNCESTRLGYTWHSFAGATV
jgi:hypothetical protein